MVPIQLEEANMTLPIGTLFTLTEIAFGKVHLKPLKNRDKPLKIDKEGFQLIFKLVEV